MSILGIFAPITSSIRYNTQRFNSISDAVNLQNVNGAKRSQVNFHTLLGDRNPSASNNVVPSSGIKTVHRQNLSEQGAISTTGRSLDLSLNGQGFFAVRQTLEVETLGDLGEEVDVPPYLTRNGSFRLQQVGTEGEQYLVDSDGHYLLGWQAPLGEEFPEQTADNLGPIQLNPEALILEGRPTDSVDMNINLPHDVNLATDSKYPQIVTVYDDGGGPRFINFEFNYKGSENEWSFAPYLVNKGGARIGDVEPALTDVTFDAQGNLPANFAFDLTYEGGAFTVDLNDVTSYGNQYGLQSVTQNGFPDGRLRSYEINNAGVITGAFNNGQSSVIAQIPVIDLANRDTLTPYNSSGGPKFSLNENSMALQVHNLLTTSHTTLNSGTLELSTIDLADVFSEMIETQHSFSISNNALQILNDMVQVAYRLKS